ncbi:MAG: hypothetical protein IKZ85_10490 [Pseudobutyrivibrio sp.]|nr:hypothetical protein [Pseudobutyrivibrio sp.]
MKWIILLIAGILGTTLLGVFLFNEKISIPQIVCVLLIVIGIVGLKLLTRE